MVDPCKLGKPRLVFLTVLFVMATLFIGSILVSDKYTSINGIWDGAMVVSGCKREQPSSPLSALPRLIVQRSSDLEPRHLWVSEKVETTSKSLLAIAAGIKQKEDVNRIVQKFPAENFTVMLFHYDGMLEEWNDLPWAARAIHVAVLNQTKWWFAKRFMHPDIVSAYHFLFIWDEDLGVDHFHADRYLDIVKKEGLEISQPALDPHLSSEVHHRITIRHKTGDMHRRIIRKKGTEFCTQNSRRPPCTGWVEMMAPVFSRAAWRCAWHLIQNDLVHGWGMDMKLGYCAQGNPSQNVGVVDSEYLVHRGIPSLGGDASASAAVAGLNKASASSPDARTEIRKRAHTEMEIFRRRWKAATEEDYCWADIFEQQ